MPFTSPFLKVRCPACGSEFHPGDCAIISSLTKNELKKAPDDLYQRLLHRFWLTPTDGSGIRELACRRCTNSGCERPLPNNIERAQSCTIAIVGDGSSGKSHYIASCINELKQRASLQVIGCNYIVPQGNSDEIYQRDYYRPVYRDKQQIRNTQRGLTIIDPLIYELVFSEQSKLQPARSVNLLFYDSSGEDMADQQTMVQYSSYILNASAIIFLADPLAMPDVVRQLPEYLRPRAPRELKTSEVMNRIIHTFQLSQRMTPGQKLKTPIAIALSKSDVLKYVTRYISPQPTFLSRSNYTNMLNTQQFNVINGEVQRLLQSVGDDVLIHSSSTFENTSFFAVSATGFHPDDKNKFPAIEPIRCLDPLLWALWKLGIIYAD